MKPLGILGFMLLIAGIIVLAMNGVSYTKDRDDIKLGPIEIVAEEKGFIAPAAGVVAVGVGVLLLFVGRGKKA